jgi:hypothetical protein
MMIKGRVINTVLWGAFILAMGASIQHLAWTFGTVERAGFEWLGWIPAIAVDAGLAALAYTIQQRKKAKRPTRALWAGVVGFAVVSALANLYHGLAVEAVVTPALAPLLTSTFVQVAKVVVLSATLPVTYIFLGEIVSGDDASAAVESERQAERERNKAEREQRRADLLAEKEAAEARARLLEAENEAQRIAQAEAQAAEAAAELAHAPVISLACPECERPFATQNALNAHLRSHKRDEPLEAARASENHNGKAH